MFRARVKAALKNADASFKGEFDHELQGLLGLSRTEIDAITPDTKALQTYDRLITVVKEASRSNLDQAELAEQITDLGEVGVRIARKVPRLGALLLKADKSDAPRERTAPIGPSSQPKQEPVRTPVRLSCSSPRAVGPGHEFTARLAAYRPQLERQVDRALRSLSPDHKTVLDVQRTRWAVNAPVTVTLRATGLTVEPESVSFAWNGEKQIVEFDVTVPSDRELGTVVLKYDVSVAGVPLIRLRTDLRISHKPDNTEASVQEDAPTTAFASYSSKDRPRVLDMVMAMEVLAGVKVFLDRRSIRSGEEWEPLLKREILNRELFMLFWSSSASRSYWVKREWQTAWSEKRPPEFQVYALQASKDAPPPEQLAHLNFEDPLMILRAYEIQSNP